MPIVAYHRFCQTRQEAGQWRVLRAVGPSQAGRTGVDGRSVINFSSNNYMGLATHPALIRRSQEWTDRWGVGATASRLVCGNLALFAPIEAKLSQGKGTEAALIFNSGFQANATVLAALLDRAVLGEEPLVFADRFNHASLHHGCRVAGVRQFRYRHNDLNHLEMLLKKYARRPGPRFIVSETVFSMDGDCCDVAGLIALKERYGAFLYLDEAHATGVLGVDGFGLAAAYPGQVDLVMGTFSKGLGGFGAYVACSQAVKAYLVNQCGGFVYSTALPPGVLGAMDAALDLLPVLGESRERLQRNSAWVRQVWQAAGLATGLSSTQIIPLLLGGEAETLEMSGRLKAAGILAVAIRPPTVPVGTSRIRFSLTALHGEADLRYLVETVLRLGGCAADCSVHERSDVAPN
ncbi:MAG: 8-amino-7-oxononanoate synthase [Magnetococcales bacterium]|nr:8-amino-7-oxononanoate synthase [Magnetococcales bacterium]